MGLFDTKHSDDLKAWLVKELEPICDADPEVLSDYVLALLKHDASEGDIEKMLTEQLDDFLGESTASFVKKALDALRSSTYLPESKRPILDSAVSSSSRKRSAEDEGRRSPPKSSRAAEGLPIQDLAAAGPSSRGPHERSSGSPGPREFQNRNRRPNQPCRDYHLKGFCPRGNECKWDHSPQAGAQLTAANGFPMMGQVTGFPLGQQAGMGRGQQAYMSRPPFPGQGPVPAHFVGMPSQPPWNSIPQGSPPDVIVPPYMPQQPAHANGAPMSDAASLSMRMGAQQPGQQDSEVDSSGAITPTSGSHSAFRGGMRGGARGNGRGGAGGGRGGGFGTFGSQARSSTTLVIENVPQDSLDLIKINDYFKKFGTITNIQIDSPGAKALVSYSQPSEAKTAHSSPDVIFGNRFVKVYFQKLDEGLNGSENGANFSSRPKVVAPPPKSNFIPGKTSNVYHAKPPASTIGAASPLGDAEGHSKAIEAQKAAQLKLDSLMAEQKQVMTKVTSGTAEEKKQGMARFKTLDGEIKQAAEDVRKAVREIQSSSAASVLSGQGPDAAKWKEQREAKERQQLDRELELHSKVGDGAGTNEELRATLAKLEAEAVSMGLDPASALSGGRGRGRGRGRSSYPSSYRGGRGGMPSGRMSLDNRTTKLRISDLPSDSEEQKAKAHEWFKQFGEIVEFKASGQEGMKENDALVVFKVRANAEAALRSGLNIPNLGQVKASWYTEASELNNAISAANAAPTSAIEDGGGSGAAKEHTDSRYDEGGEGDEDKDDHFRR